MTGARPQRICVARIGAPHGVRGEVKLWSFTADPLAIADYGPLETQDGTRIEIESVRAAKDHLIVRLTGVSDRDAAARLTNSDLFVGRDRLPDPDDADEFYHADLVGLAVVDTRGTGLGTVLAVHNFGAGDLIEVQPQHGGATVLLAFTVATVPEVDIGSGRIVVDADSYAAAAAPARASDDET